MLSPYRVCSNRVSHTKAKFSPVYKVVRWRRVYIVSLSSKCQVFVGRSLAKKMSSIPSSESESQAIRDHPKLVDQPGGDNSNDADDDSMPALGEPASPEGDRLFEPTSADSVRAQLRCIIFFQELFLPITVTTPWKLRLVRVTVFTVER